MVKCKECKQEIDPTTCWCGDPIETHSITSGHCAVAMECGCARSNTKLIELCVDTIRNTLIKLNLPYDKAIAAIRKLKKW